MCHSVFKLEKAEQCQFLSTEHLIYDLLSKSKYNITSILNLRRQQETIQHLNPHDNNLGHFVPI